MLPTPRASLKVWLQVGAKRELNKRNREERGKEKWKRGWGRRSWREDKRSCGNCNTKNSGRGDLGKRRRVEGRNMQAENGEKRGGVREDERIRGESREISAEEFVQHGSQLGETSES